VVFAYHPEGEETRPYISLKVLVLREFPAPGLEPGVAHNLHEPDIMCIGKGNSRTAGDERPAKGRCAEFPDYAMGPKAVRASFLDFEDQPNFVVVKDPINTRVPCRAAL
jgi:hypothetical protein